MLKKIKINRLERERKKERNIKIYIKKFQMIS